MISPPPRSLQVFLALAGGVVLFILLLSALGLGYGLMQRGRIFPGIAAVGVDLSGLDPVQAAVALAQQVPFPQEGRIAFHDGAGENSSNRVFETTPANLGLALDLEETVRQAYNLGRSGNPLRRVLDQIDAWYDGRDVAPVLTYNEAQAQEFLAGVAAEIDRPTLEATLTIQGTDVVATPGQVGRRVDIAATLEPLAQQLQAMSDGMLALVVVETPPQILEAGAAQAEARQILSAPLTLAVPDAAEGDPLPWKIEPQQLAKMIVLESVPLEGTTTDEMTFRVSLDLAPLRTLLEGAAGSLGRQPVNARFIFNDDTQQLELLKPAVIGRSLNIAATLENVQRELLAGNHSLALQVDLAPPEVVSEASGEQLGIRELVSKHTSFFYGSSAARIHNIEVAAAQFHGLLVPPGATFSMAANMGDVSLDNGYTEALIIVGGKTIEGVGGGVCQVSTTLFRTAFFGGFPIVERYSHAYRVGYYEQNASGGYDENLAGLDATVYVPVVDFKFSNDTPYWLLMETYVNVRARTLTWKFYSTSDGRTVEWNTSGLMNPVTAPEPQYVENADLAEGEIRQVDYEADGADVTVTRVVYRDGGIYLQDAITTHYQPWRAVYEYGPGTKIPKKKK